MPQITDTKTPIIIVVGPASSGKSMIMVTQSSQILHISILRNMSRIAVNLWLAFSRMMQCLAM